MSYRDDRPRWHYTIGHRWRHIERDQRIIPATAGVRPPERPAVWASANPLWEPTANKMAITPGGKAYVLTKEETARHGGGLIRIGLTCAATPIDWYGYLRQSRVNLKHAAALAGAGRRAGADPLDWFVSFEPIPGGQWLRVERWDDQQKGWVLV